MKTGPGPNRGGWGRARRAPRVLVVGNRKPPGVTPGESTGARGRRRPLWTPLAEGAPGPAAFRRTRTQPATPAGGRRRSGGGGAGRARLPSRASGAIAALRSTVRRSSSCRWSRSWNREECDFITN